MKGPMCANAIWRRGQCQRGARNVSRMPSNYQALAQPAVDELPPDKSHPFVEIRFGPLAMAPPRISKLLGIIGRGHVDRGVRKLTPEYAGSAAGMKIRGHQQNRSRSHFLRALSSFKRLGLRRQAANRADAHLRSLW